MMHNDAFKDPKTATPAELTASIEWYESSARDSKLPTSYRINLRNTAQALRAIRTDKFGRPRK